MWYYRKSVAVVASYSHESYKIGKSHHSYLFDLDKINKFADFLKSNIGLIVIYMIFSSHVGSVFANLVAQTFGIVFLVAYDIFQKSVKPEMFQNNFWSVPKKLK